MPKELRPAEVIWAYWDSVLVLEEDAIRMEPMYLEEDFVEEDYLEIAA